MIDANKLASLYRLKSLIRYNTRTRLKDETVAEHSYYVALFSLMICDKFDLDEKVRYECLVKSILHDLPEIEMNDITHDAKIRLGLSDIISSYEKEYYDREFPSFASMMNLDDDSISSLIVNLADVESVRQYINNEASLGNNSSDICQVHYESIERLACLEAALLTKINERGNTHESK